jgi:polysaccharide export outer membrane protein
MGVPVSLSSASVPHCLRLLALVCLTALALGGCAALPTTGPTSRQIEMGERVGAADSYVLLDLNPQIVSELNNDPNLGLSRRLMTTKIKDLKPRIGVGDVLQITVWEAGEGGLFSSQSGRSASFPSMVVSPGGEISLPYAGIVKVAGKTPFEVQKRIVDNLSDRAIQPQATVSITENRANTVVLNGEVSKPGLYPLSLKGDRLLDVIAAGGGTKFPARETNVLVIRGEQRAQQLLTAIVEDHQENILIQTGDQIYVNYEPRRYTVVGAVQKPGVYPFEAIQVNVLEAVAATGGLIDSRADAGGVFVFRHERSELVRKFSSAPATKSAGRVPVVYRINMRSPEAFFFASGFKLRDKDVVYVANAEGAEASKLLRLVNLATSSAGIGTRVVGSLD